MTSPNPHGSVGSSRKFRSICDIAVSATFSCWLAKGCIWSNKVFSPSCSVKTLTDYSCLQICKFSGYIGSITKVWLLWALTTALTAVHAQAVLDSDLDGMPDAWEIQYGLDPLDHAMDGDLVVPAGQSFAVDSVRSSVLGTNVSGDSTLHVTSTNGFQPKDYVLVITMQDREQDLSKNQTGIYEIHRILSLTNDALVLREPLTNSFNSTPSRIIQVLKVPYYRSVLLDGIVTCSAWDGRTGGLLAMFCQTSISFGPNGAITADAVGYRGGASIAAPANSSLPGIPGNPGEGFAGENGGEASSSSAACGGGGGFGSAGQDGYGFPNTKGGIGGSPYGTADLIRLYLGSGGGGTAADPIYFPGTEGGRGGGIVYLVCNTIQGEAKVTSRGGAGASRGFNVHSALPDGSGGGSGGSIQVRSKVLLSLTADATGGRGGRRPISEFGGGFVPVGGGNGGDGRIRLDLAPGSLIPTTSPATPFVSSANTLDLVLHHVPDTDHDGLSDLEEYQQQTDPTKPDTDGDGLSDYWEVRNHFNPKDSSDAVLDPDSDGLTNLDEFLRGTDPKNADTDGDSMPDGWEIRFGLNPNEASDSAEDLDKDGLTNLDEYRHQTLPSMLDTDGDGLPDAWEVQHNLNPNNPNDALTDPDGDSLSNLFELRIRSNPQARDTDGDELDDGAEYRLYGTSPLLTDTDGDGIPDPWEIQHSLNPRVNDGMEDHDHDGLSNLEEYEQTVRTGILSDPSSAFSLNDQVSDYERATGSHRSNRFYYDRNDRLVGAEYDNGLAIAYAYDGNDNLIRQVHLSRNEETNGLPVLWRFLNNLLKGASSNITFDDPDRDGWTNFQEWQAGSDPNSATSTPSVVGNSGEIVSTLGMPFSPSNFVVAVGQLDGIGPEEIVISADGDPSGHTNALFILSQQAQGWTSQRVELGQFGVTSIAIGQLTTRSAPAIYLGFRRVGGAGGVVEVTQNENIWQMATNDIAVSELEAAFVVGVRPNQDLLASLSSLSTEGALWSLYLTNGIWARTLLSTNRSGQAVATVMPVFSRTNRHSAVRLLESGDLEIYASELEVFKGDKQLPHQAVLNPTSGKWHFRSPTALWDEAKHFFEDAGGNLVSLENEGERDWLIKQYPSLQAFWVGLRIVDTNPIRYRWVNGSDSFQPWSVGQPSLQGCFTCPVFMDSSGHTVIDLTGSPLVGVGEVSGASAFTNQWLIHPSPTTRRINWSSCRPVWMRSPSDSSNSTALFQASVLDHNGSHRLDEADSLLLESYDVLDNIWKTNSVVRIPIHGESPAQSYGLALAQLDMSRGTELFTAEPDGQIFRHTIGLDFSITNRRLFSDDHIGHTWHALAAVSVGTQSDGLIGLRISPTNDSVINVAFWSPKPVVEVSTPTFRQTAPVVTIMPSADLSGSQVPVTIRLWDAEGNAATPFLQYQLAGSTRWQDATLVKIDGEANSTNTRVTALPSGTDHTLVWDALSDLREGMTTNIILRARARDVSLLGEWSLPVPLHLQISQDPDSDGDGMPDTWEDAHLLDKLANDAVLDSDGDGLVNIDEYLAGTDPQDAASGLNLSVTLVGLDALNLSFMGVQGHSYTILSRDEHLMDDWRRFAEIKTRPSSGTVNVVDTTAGGTARFYRLVTPSLP